MSYLLDTNICIALLKNADQKLISQIKQHSPRDIYLCSIVKAELIFGAKNSHKVDANLALLSEFFAPFLSYDFNDIAADYYGSIRTILTRAGTPIGANDLLIASIALANNLTLVSRNRAELLRVPGLQLVSW